MQQISEALSTALVANVVHLDVKTNNVMVDRALDAVRAVLIDFGCAKELNSDLTITVGHQHLRGFALEGNQCGRAPELFIELEAAKREVAAHCSPLESARGADRRLPRSIPVLTL